MVTVFTLDILPNVYTKILKGLVLVFEKVKKYIYHHIFYKKICCNDFRGLVEIENYFLLSCIVQCNKLSENL